MKLKPKTVEMLVGFLFILPVMASVILFLIIPILKGVGYSFTDWGGIGQPHFIGLKNYIKAITEDEVTRKAIFNTFILTFFGTVLNLSIGYLAANLLFNIKGRFEETGKVILFIPYILSMAVVGVLFSFVFASTDFGLLNKVLSIFKTEPYPWFGSESTAMPAVIVTYIWKDYGFYLLLYLAGLKSLPASLIESADIDGATEWQKIRYIKIPYLKPITQLLVVLSVINYMLTFTMVMFLTPDGGPARSTETVASWFYKQSFEFWKFGYGASIAVILAVIVMIMSFLLRKAIKVEET